MNSIRIKNEKGGLYIRGEPQVSVFGKSVPLKTSAKGEREREMRPGKQDKKEARPPKI